MPKAYNPTKSVNQVAVSLYISFLSCFAEGSNGTDQGWLG